VALPATVAVPTVVPPLVHVDGAVVWGPNTLKVTVPVAPAVAPDKVELTDDAATAVPAVPVAGPLAVVVVALVTAVEAIPLPHVLAEAALLESPP
jgi:hypothetical protein